ncbi:MAG TPA: transposase [Actinomycetes bacterium]|nr:transposase [Actinomycetes bacterium]
MASRLYRTTRPLYLQVSRVLDHLGIAAVGSVTTAILIALYVTGLVLLAARPTQTRVTRVLPGRCHDALNRLLRSMPLSTRTLMALLIGWIRRSGTAGYVCLDDVVVEKAFAKRLPWAGWTYSFAKKRKVYGMHVVVLLWCSTDGIWRIPVAFRLWRPKRTCAPHRYQTKLQLAAGMLTEVVAARLPFQYLVMDTHYTAGWFTRLAGRLQLTWVGTLAPRTTVVWRGRRQQVVTLARQLRLGWRPRLGLRAAAVRVYTPTHGMVRLVVTRNRHGNYDYLVTSDPAADLATVVVRKQSRWQVETIFRDTKQYAGLGACQCWTDQAMVRHVALVLVGFVVLQQLRRDPTESLAAVKERWQLAITRQGEQPPVPLKASPAHLRATA